VADYFANPERAQQAGRAGRAVIEAQKGALARTLTGLEALLPR
jgi:3-deoxy-D-manno-octulosonic-acid transferase